MFVVRVTRNGKVDKFRIENRDAFEPDGVWYVPTGNGYSVDGGVTVWLFAA